MYIYDGPVVDKMKHERYPLNVTVYIELVFVEGQKKIVETN
jgi:hypothetical protein